MAVEESFKNIWKKVLYFPLMAINFIDDGCCFLLHVMFTVDKQCSNIIVCSVRVMFESELMQDFLNIRDHKKVLLVCVSHIF